MSGTGFLNIDRRTLKYVLAALIVLGFLLFEGAAFTLEFIGQTESNGSTRNMDWFEMYVSVSDGSLSVLGFNLNGADHILYDESLVLALNLNNNSAIGENDTLAVDISRHGNNGTLKDGNSSNPDFYTPPQWRSEGRFNGSLEFDGLDDYVEFKSSDIWNAIDGLTVSAWIRSNSTSRGRVLSRGLTTSPTKWWYLELYNISGACKARFSVKGGVSVSVMGASVINDGTWHHIAGAFDSSGVRLFVDGVEEGNSTTYPGLVDETAPLFIGRDSALPDMFFNGSVDEVRVYNKSLNSSILSEYYQNELRKFNDSEWGFYLNATGLPDGEYAYYVWANDTNNYFNKTETRTLSIDTSTSTVNLANCSNLTSNNTVYLLNSDVSSNGTCMRIKAHNMTLDCKGHKINYSLSSAGYGIDNSYGFNYIKIKNCSLLEDGAFPDSFGIYFNESDDGVIEGNTVNTYSMGSAGIYIGYSSRLNITSNSMYTENAYAIYVKGLSNSYHYDHKIDPSNKEVGKNIHYYFNLSLSTVEDLDNVGQLYIAASDNVTVRNISLSGDGIILAMTENSKIKDCNISASGKMVHGVALESYSGSNTVFNNTIETSGFKSHGVYLNGPSNGNTVSKNTIRTVNQDGCGINLVSSSGSNLSGNMISTSGINAYGICFYSDSDFNNVTNSVIESMSLGIYFSHLVGKIPENNSIYNCLINSSTRPVDFNVGYNGSNMWNTSEKNGVRTYSGGVLIGGSYYTNPAGSGYSDTCNDSEGDGFCDQPYDVLNNKSCTAWVDCSNNTDYLPLSGGYSNVFFSIELVEPENDTLINVNVTYVSFNVTGSNLTYNCSIYADGLPKWSNSSVENNTLTYVIADEIADGSHPWYVNCTAEGVSNVSETRTLNVDTTPATIEIVNPANNMNLSAAATWTWINISTDESATCRYNLSTPGFDYESQGVDLSTTDGMNHSFFFSGLTEGTTYTIYYKCNDSAGNINPSSTEHTFSVNATDSSIEIIYGCRELNESEKTYVLNQNVSSDGTCMTVKADNVTLDCQGYKISFSYIAVGAGVENMDGYADTTVKNCHIKKESSLEVTYGIDFQNVAYGVIENNVIELHGNKNYGIKLYQSSLNNILENTIDVNGSESVGILFEKGSYQNTVRSSRISSLKNQSIRLVEMGGSAPENNLIYNNIINSSTLIGFYGAINVNYWNTTKQGGLRIDGIANQIGGNYYTNAAGSGYSDWCVDSDGDGFCNQFNITTDLTNIDYLPLSDNQSYCGNGVKETGEACDGSEYGGITCVSSGYVSGSLSCVACTSINYAGCIPYTNDPDNNDGGGSTPVNPPKETCFDGIQNQDEEDVDCGGSCAPCMSCSDGVQNQGETGIDCGGPCPACPDIQLTTTTTSPATISTTLAGSADQGVETGSHASDGSGGPSLVNQPTPLRSTPSSTVVSTSTSIAALTPVSGKSWGQDTLNLAQERLFGFISGMYEVMSNNPVESCASILLLSGLFYIYYSRIRTLGLEKGAMDVKKEVEGKVKVKKMI